MRTATTLKSANILVAERPRRGPPDGGGRGDCEWQLKIADFGTSRLLHDDRRLSGRGGRGGRGAGGGGLAAAALHHHHPRSSGAAAGGAPVSAATRASGGNVRASGGNGAAPLVGEGDHGGRSGARHALADMTGGVGTALYMAPELLVASRAAEGNRGARESDDDGDGDAGGGGRREYRRPIVRCGCAVDVYSFGIVLWDVVARRPPWYARPAPATGIARDERTNEETATEPEKSAPPLSQRGAESASAASSCPLREASSAPSCVAATSLPAGGMRRPISSPRVRPHSSHHPPPLPTSLLRVLDRYRGEPDDGTPASPRALHDAAATFVVRVAERGVRPDVPPRADRRGYDGLGARDSSDSYFRVVQPPDPYAPCHF